MENNVEEARKKWVAASEHASKLANKLFQTGSGCGDPDARANDEHRLQSAREETERLFREYHDRKEIEVKMLKLQKSQHLPTWASFVVAAVVGIVTCVSIIVSLLGYIILLDFSCCV